ncbi:hypothetical protein LG307_03660 [Sutcliffiella horikoshii]|uniref:hypothetical protein n=1 Tax=Sutcliffiella horikoshii TaxID=79883 RepID=UPI0038514E79
MNFMGGVLFLLGIFALFNVFLSLLYILSKTAGNGFYHWVTHDFDILIILSAPFFGVTQWVATSIYDRFNWFVARLILVFYSLLALILAIVIFVMFGYIADMQ